VSVINIILWTRFSHWGQKLVVGSCEKGSEI
jgi:hypothetical protein